MIGDVAPSMGSAPIPTTSSMDKAPVSYLRNVLFVWALYPASSSVNEEISLPLRSIIFNVETGHLHIKDRGRGTRRCSECGGPFAAGFLETGLASAIALLPPLGWPDPGLLYITLTFITLYCRCCGGYWSPAIVWSISSQGNLGLQSLTS